MKPFFSIVIPTLNEEKFLPNLLSDLQKQTTMNFEVIITDGHSEDKTKLKAFEYKKSLPLTFLEHTRNNVSVQRNLGAKKGKGNYLIFLDADSRVIPSFTKKLEANIKKYKGLFFVPNLKTDDPNTETQFVLDVINSFFELSQNLGRPFAMGGGMVFERKYFFTIGGFDHKLDFGEDYEIALRSYHWGVRAKYLKEVSVIYSLRRIRNEGKLKSYYKIFISTVLYLIKGKTERKLFDYELGGHLYDKSHIINTAPKSHFDLIIKRAKKAFNNLLKEESFTN